MTFCFWRCVCAINVHVNSSDWWPPRHVQGGGWDGSTGQTRCTGIIGGCGGHCLQTVGLVEARFMARGPHIICPVACGLGKNSKVRRRFYPTHWKSQWKSHKWRTPRCSWKNNS